MAAKPKKSNLSPAARTLRSLRSQGLLCGIVERFNPFAGSRGTRHDLFGIIDIIALDPRRGVIGVQACGESFSTHWTKLTIEEEDNTRAWLETPGTALEIWSWALRKKKLAVGYSENYVWTPRVAEITLSDLKKPYEGGDHDV